MFLTDEELLELTARQRCNAQARALAAMGINYKPRPDGSLAVLKSHVEEVLGRGVASGARPTTRKSAPDFSQVR